MKMPGEKKDGEAWRQVARYTALAVMLPVSTAIGYAIGYTLDKAFGTSYLKIVCLLLGIASGFVQLIRDLNRDT
jgi:F0F1-type ATP synthase assembly protein I